MHRLDLEQPRLGLLLNLGRLIPRSSRLGLELGGVLHGRLQPGELLDGTANKTESAMLESVICEKVADKRGEGEGREGGRGAWGGGGNARLKNGRLVLGLGFHDLRERLVVLV